MELISGNFQRYNSSKKAYLIVLGIFLIISSSCSDSQLEVPPNAYFLYDGEEYATVRGTSSWTYKKTGVETDSPAPAELVNYQEESLIVNESDPIKIKFDVEPNKYNVYEWKDIDDKEEVNIRNNVITVPSDIESVIYEMHAFWDQGDAYYSIKVSIDE